MSGHHKWDNIRPQAEIRPAMSYNQEGEAKMSYLSPSRTYKAILRGDRVEWCGQAPDQQSPMEVQITVTEPEPSPAKRGWQMAAALERLAAAGGIPEIADPVQWQRETRQGRPLAGRAD